MLIAGRYRLRDTIGRGAMGEVWQAFDETLGRPVAVKLLLPHDSDPTASSRFRLEAQTAGRLSHPNVVGVLDFGEHDDRLFLVMELVDGGSLAGLLTASGPLPVERVAHIAAQAAVGLATAHRQGIVHRDIKPANLLLGADGTLKIGDFGIARFLDDPGAALTATGQIVGTSLYLAPERALGRAAGPASDVYSLGCVLYQLLSGRPPFQADSALAVLHQHLDATPAPLRPLRPDLPPAFESYLLGLLAKEPEGRPTAEEAADWFGRGAWRGAPEPLPLPSEHREHGRPTRPHAPGQHAPGRHATGPRAAAPASHRSAPASHRSAPANPRSNPAAVHRSAPTVRSDGAFAPAADTEWQTSVHRAAPRRPRRPSPLRSRWVAVLGGACLFALALLAGMLWFSPGTGSAQEPRTTPSTSASPAASAPSSGTPSTSSSLPAQPAGQDAEQASEDGQGGPKETDKRGKEKD
ncbi:protein kinase [Streptomyces sp. NPDC048106]|uniref:serine/threonine-protein kinase n=1 Tax=Streptomyces sp. NPDC048106 TaxID=3155750 RepID=UPI00345122DF